LPVPEEDDFEPKIEEIDWNLYIISIIHNYWIRA
jgi:hypothetical protein